MLSVSRPVGASSGIADNVVHIDTNSAKVIYANASGDDGSGLGTAGNPYRTLVRALADVPTVAGPREAVVLDITNLGTEVLPMSGTSPLLTHSLPIVLAGGLGRDINLTVMPFANWFVTYPFTIRATPTTVATLTAGTWASAADPTTGRKTLTITPDPGWAVNQHRGNIVASAVPSSSVTGVVISNTSNQLVVSVTGTFPAGDILIATQSATLDLNGGQLYWGAPASVNAGLLGLRFTNGAATAYQLYGGSAAMVLQHCRFDGTGVFSVSGSPRVRYQHCYFNQGGGTFSAGIHLTGCFVRAASMGFRSTGPGDAHVLTSTTFSGCTGLGSDLLASFEVSGGARFSISNCTIEDAVGAGLTLAGGHHDVRSTEIKNSSSHGILATRPGTLVRLGGGVIGTGNGGFGVRGERGAMVRALAGTTLTGASGDARVGSVGATAWASIIGGNVPDFAGASAEGVVFYGS